MSITLSDTSTWLPLDGLAPGFDANKAPATGDLDGRTVTVVDGRGTRIVHRFGADRVEWDYLPGDGDPIEASSGSDAYEAFLVDDGLYFAQFHHEHKPDEAVSLVLDLTNGRALSVIQAIGGDFPGTILIPRLYALHILLIPGIILALIGAHLALVWFQKHTQFPGPGRTETNVVGVRVMPVFAVKSGAFFAMITGVLGLMGGLLTINPIWQLGPYKPSQVSAGSQPDFYMMWTEGLARIWPAWEFYPFGHTIPAVVWVAVIMGGVFTLLIAYPFIEKKITGDDAHHNLLQRPRDVPVRTAIGAMAIAFYIVLTLAAMNDIIALKFHISLNATTWIGRIGMVVLPGLVYYIAYRWAVSLQRSDRAVLEHGIETGIIKRLPHGAYVELHQPLGPVDDHGHPIPLQYQGAALPKRMNKLGSGGAPGTGSFLFADPAVEQEALTEASHASEQKALTALRDGKVDAYFGDAMRSAFWLNDNPACCAFAGEAYFRPELFGEGLAIAVPAGNDAVRHAIDWALVRLKENGALDELYLRWFPVGFY